MTIFKDVLSELVGMFVADGRLAAAVLVVVAMATVLVWIAGLPIAGGIVLVLGCPAVLIEGVRREALRRRVQPEHSAVE